jgi:hypothetical protein
LSSLNTLFNIQWDFFGHSAIAGESDILGDSEAFFSIAECNARQSPSDVSSGWWYDINLMNNPTMMRIYTDINLWLCKNKDEKSLTWLVWYSNLSCPERQLWPGYPSVSSSSVGRKMTRRFQYILFFILCQSNQFIENCVIA